MRSPHFGIFNDAADEEHGEHYFIRSNHWYGQKDQKKVLSSVLGLIQLINGASALEWGFSAFNRMRGISFDELYFTEHQNPRDSDWDRIYEHEEIVPSNPFIGKPEDHEYLNPFSHITTSYLELSIDHEDIFNLLLQTSNGFDWRNLYCIWDTVVYYGGEGKHHKAIANLDLDDNKISSFTGTVNSFGVLGLEARHGVKSWKIPQNVVSHEDAVETINEVVKKYLSSHYCLRCEMKKWKPAV